MENSYSFDNIRYNESKNTIKIWPFLDDMSSVIFPYPNKYLSNDVNMVVNLDFSKVRKVNSSCAAITVKKLVSLVTQSKTKRPYKLNMPEDEFIRKRMQDIGFFSILDSYCCFDSYFGDLFDENQPVIIQKEAKLCVDEDFNLKKTSFPIFVLEYNPNDTRESVDRFEGWLDSNLLERLDENYHVKTDVLFCVLTEIAKNSQDHTENNAFFGFDLIENKIGGDGELLFSCSDLGGGIAQMVRKYLKEHPQEYLRSDIWRHGSLTDYYKWAFTLGNSTSTKSNNKGIGMTMIIDGAHELNMDLFFFDAWSMMQIPNTLFHRKNALNHEELRRKVWNTENRVGFYYYGRLKL